MMHLIDPKLDHYIEDQFSESDSVLADMARYGEARNFPFVGAQVGRLLFILTKLAKARRVFEMGSGFGYSAYWFAKALPADGLVVQTEFSSNHSAKAREFFEEAGLSKRSRFRVGDAIRLLNDTDEIFDIIFLDLNKEDYPAALGKAKPRIRAGGLLIADNVLWSGRVVEPEPDAATQGILEFTRLLFGDKDFFATILPIRDGVAVGYKL